jgi:hypothetical protein
MTAGTAPMMIEPVSGICTCPKANAPRAADAVNGMACVRSVPTRRRAARFG